MYFMNFDGPVNITHLDISNFFKDASENIDYLIDQPTTVKSSFCKFDCTRFIRWCLAYAVCRYVDIHFNFGHKFFFYV